MKCRLGGSLFIRDAIKYDYCVIESISSMIPVCDRIVVLDCGSTDGTLDMLKRAFQYSRKVQVCSDAYWPCAADNHRIAILANVAKSLLECDWHFMLQADEIIHENSYRVIREVIDHPEYQQYDSFQVRRVNFYGHPSQHVRYDIETSLKPCDDHPTRLALQDCDAIGDGESVHGANTCTSMIDKITIHHYGFVRRPLALVDKTVDAYKWFFAGHNQDSRFKRMQDDGEYRWQEIMHEGLMTPFLGCHPKVIRPWLYERWGTW